MDPVTAFGIACGVIQIVDFGFKVTRNIWTIVKSSSGTLIEYEEIETAAAILQDLMNALKAQNGRTNIRHTTRPMPEPSDTAISIATAQSIRQIALQCEETATKLINLLNEIKADPKKYKSTMSRTFKAIRGIPKSSKISKLESQLEEYRKKLEKHIIVDLRQTSRALLSGMTQGFEDLQADHKVIVTAIANNESNIAKLITAEGYKIRGDLAAFGKKLDDIEYKEKLESFVNSFAFKDMFEREDRMTQQPAAPRTFRWLFDRDHSKERPYDNFIEWLEGDQTVYWICGKAGSGKSTLMSFIWDHPDSKKDECLQKWSARKELVTAAVFFWSQGSPLQKSPAGLLRSLVYQILRQNKIRASKVMDLQKIAQSTNLSWTEARLMPLLLSILDDPDIRVCFFIDGLDEYGSGDVVANNALLKILFKLIEHGNGRLKCCVSSRPLRAFELSLEKSPKLMLHKLTRSDITCYVEDSLGKAAEGSFTKEIVSKANGVFLWAFFAVKSLQTAQINGDTSNQIRQRLDELPSELYDLYSHMLLKIDHVYWKEAGLYLALAVHLYYDKLSVVHFILASKDNYFEELALPWTQKRIQALRKDCADMERWLKVRTAGLLEVEVSEFPLLRHPEHGSPSLWFGEKDVLEYDGAISAMDDPDLKTYYDLLELRKTTELTLKSETFMNSASNEKVVEHSLFHRRVTCIHRSVAQFLESNQSHEILKLCSKGTAIVKSIQADVVLFTFRDNFGFQMDDYIHDRQLRYLMFIVGKAEGYTTQPNRPYIDLLGTVLQTVKGVEWPANDPEYFATTFLELMAEYGFNLYVQDVLKNDPLAGKENRQLVINNVLRCATSVGLYERWDYGPFLGQRLKLIKFLLDEGANPNDVALRRLSKGNITAWEAFLGLAVRVRDDWIYDYTNNLHIPEFHDVLKLFLAHGVDPCQEFVHNATARHIKNNNQFKCLLRANAAFALELYGIPCGLARSRAAVEEVEWQASSQHESPIYLTTLEGSAMLVEAFILLLKTPYKISKLNAAGRNFYQRCLEVRKSAHDLDYTKPPLAEHYTGSQKLEGEEDKWTRFSGKEWSRDDSDD